MVESNEDETLPMIKEIYDLCLLLNHTENWMVEFFGNKDEKFLKYMLEDFFFELTQKTLLNSKYKYQETLVYSSKTLEQILMICMKLIHLDHPKIIETTQKLLDIERRFY